MAVDCPAKGPQAIARKDKLLTHLRTHHSKNTSFLCPAPLCNEGPFPPDLLCVHLNFHVNRDDYSSRLYSLGAMCFSCPVQDCTKSLVRYRHTLNDHDIATRKHNASAILAAGYNPTSGLAVCPICNAELPYRSWLWCEALLNHFKAHDGDSLYTYRREILKVCPQIAGTKVFQPVFEDIMPTVNRKSVGSGTFLYC